MTTEQKPRTRSESMLANLLLIIFLGVLLCVEGYSGWQLHQLSSQQEDIKNDYGNANDITLGLFSIEQWRDKVNNVINHQVRHFELTPEQKNQIQLEVQDIIYTLIDKAEALINQPQKSLGGKIKQFAIKKFVNKDKIKAQVPGIAKTIIGKIDNQGNKNKISDLALSKFEKVQKSAYLDSTIHASDSIYNRLYVKYNVTSQQTLNSRLDLLLDDIRTEMYGYSYVMLGCVVIVLLLWWVVRKRLDLHVTLFVMSLLFAFILLGVGLTASMIEVDARIKSLNFTLLGEHIVFKNQVLFVQSKSILDVVEVLVKQPAADSIGVGILILVFSILFPITKLTSTGLHLLGGKKIAESKFVKYFAFQSGKWSMADVIVIAILMVYVGLNGLLEAQLASMNINSDHLSIITTNNTALQPGYIIFICFVLYGLILSTILKFITPYDTH